ncbi:MAG: hypothetical protein HYZ53_07780 [Planctomycetes bacterium]|nr:hypothetical protein [Planctomycetota bacterium]
MPAGDNGALDAELTRASDAELIRRCTLLTWERWVERAGGIGGALFVVFLLAETFERQLENGSGGGLAIAFCGPILAGLAGFGGWHAGRFVSTRRSLAARHELRRRLGDLPPAAYLDELRATLPADARALLLCGEATPRGAHVFVRVVLSSWQGTLVAVTHPPFRIDEGDLEPGRIRRLERALGPAEAEELLELLEEPLENVSAWEDDQEGPRFPAEWVLLGPGREASPAGLSTNLPGLGGPEDDAPIARLQARLLELASIALPGRA